MCGRSIKPEPKASLPNLGYFFGRECNITPTTWVQHFVDTATYNGDICLYDSLRRDIRDDGQPRPMTFRVIAHSHETWAIRLPRNRGTFIVVRSHWHTLPALVLPKGMRREQCAPRSGHRGWVLSQRTNSGSHNVQGSFVEDACMS